MKLVARALTAALAIVAVGATGVVAMAQGERGDRRALLREREIVSLMNKAIGAVQRDRTCRPALPPLGQPPTFTDDAPSAELLDTLGILRRPQAAEELLPDNAFFLLAAKDIYRSYVRIARSASGRAFVIVPARNTSFYEPRPRRCIVELRRRFARLIAGHRTAFRRAARRELERIIRTEWAARDPGPVEGVTMLDYRPEGGPGGGSGGGDADLIRRRGAYSTSASGSIPFPSVVNGLLPDPVVTVTVSYPRKASRGPHRPPQVYAKAVTLTVPVQDNVISFTVPRFPADAFPSRQVWRAADGRVIRVVE
jgi:hypothetical protein